MVYRNTNDPDRGLPDPLATEIAGSVTPLPASDIPVGRIHARLLARIHAGQQPEMEAGNAASPCPFLTLHNSGEPGDGWIEMLPKAHARLLFTDGVAESYMIRLEPGAWAPAHEHPADEECLVLEGTLWQGDVFLQAGDFHVARPGMKHGDLRTDTGALVYIRYGRPLAQYLQL